MALSQKILKSVLKLNEGTCDHGHKSNVIFVCFVLL